MRSVTLRHLLLASAAFASIPAVAHAQIVETSAVQPTAAEQGAEQVDQVQEPLDNRPTDRVVVTGSRIAREGYEAPTPLDVISADQITSSAGGNVASLLATMPVFSGSVTPNFGANAQTPSNGLGGLNLANIRGLGVNRSLVLLDGQRFVPTLTNGSTVANAVDIGGIPQQLIASVETVTGGASAVYGSDAIGGVTNFILDKDFTGFKADISGGGTSYDDGYNWKVDLSGGMPFADGRGHLLVSASAVHKDQIKDSSNRDWDSENNYCVMRNPAYTNTNGAPFNITVDDCAEITAPGGVIINGPLRGTTFGGGGLPVPYIYGPFVFAQTTSGGPGSYTLAAKERLTRGGALDNGEERKNLFARVSYALTDTINMAFTSSWSESDATTQAIDNWFTGAADITIQSNNAFIPASLRSALAGTTSFNMTHLNGDLPPVTTTHIRKVVRNALSFDGAFDMFGTNWTWDAYYQTGKSMNSLNAYSLSRSRWVKAYNAVVGPNGTIVCSVNADANPNNNDPLCVPYNLFGTGVNPQTAVDYLLTRGHVSQSNQQDVIAGSITGEPFSLWAGPVSVALSAEHRKEKAYGGSDPNALANDLYSGNYKPVNGEDTVTEGAIEVLIPLAKGQAFADTWDLQLAARLTDYESAGEVTTWKVGTTYSPFPDLRFRANISHDIRAGNLGELYAFAGAPFPSTVLDLQTGVQQSIRQSSTGNPNLKPEEAESYGVGVVVQPGFLPNLSMSVDYWRVDLDGLIAALTPAQAIQLCYNGNQSACGFLIRTGPATLPGSPGTPFAGQMFSPIDQVVTSYLNIAKSEQDGVDFSATYRVPAGDLLPGALTLSWDQNFYFATVQDPGIPGSNPNKTRPYWRALGSIRYSDGPISGGITGRLVSENFYVAATQPQVIECQSGCPSQLNLPANMSTRNYIFKGGSFFLDANFAYDFDLGGTEAQAYLNVRNILNTDPPILPGGAVFGIHQSNVGDDMLGRIMRVGMRFKM